MSDQYDYEQEDKAIAAELAAQGVPNQLVREFQTKRESRDRLKAESDTAERAYREVEARVWEAMDDNGDQLIKREVDGSTVRLERRSTIYSRVIDLDALIDTLERTGRAEELTRLGIEKKRLNELVRECLEQGIPVPEGADWYEKKYIRYGEE